MPPTTSNRNVVFWLLLLVGLLAPVAEGKGVGWNAAAGVYMANRVGGRGGGYHGGKGCLANMNTCPTARNGRCEEEMLECSGGNGSCPSGAVPDSSVMHA